MASILVSLMGAFLFGLGGWILWLRIEGMIDRYYPSSLTIGQVTIDGVESKGQAEILRARFDLYFRSTRPISSDTGFLDVVTLNAPELFQPAALQSPGKDVEIEVAGVDVWRIVESLVRVARPPVWLVEADFTSRADRALLTLRLRRGPRVIRTWYLESRKGRPEVDATLFEHLTDEAIFRIVHDFWSDESEPEMMRWRRALPPPRMDERDEWPNPTAVAAYFRAQGALARYYQLNDWKDLDAALDDLRVLRIQMPEFPAGLQLLAMALTERGEVHEAIHVYGRLRPLLENREHGATARVLSVDLLQATATTKLHTWQSAHRAMGELNKLASELQQRLREDRAPPLDDAGRAAHGELYAHCAVQLAHTYALYLEFLQYHTITEVFGDQHAPEELALKTKEELARLRPDANPAVVREAVTQFVRRLKEAHEKWIKEAETTERILGRQRSANRGPLWAELVDGVRRQNEVSSRKSLTKAYAKYRMAEWERRQGDPDALDVFGSTYEDLLRAANEDLRLADGLHPNHYRVLQLLALANSDPRDAGADLNVAEQYVERAIRANPFDTGGHEIFAAVLLRRVAHHGIDWDMKPTIEAGLAQAREAVRRRETSFAGHLLRAELQTALVVLETEPSKRAALLAELSPYRVQARRFMPKAFTHGDPQLAWMEIAADLALLRADGEGRNDSGPRSMRERRREIDERVMALHKRLEKLLEDCEWYETHWVPNQRLFAIGEVKRRAQELNDSLRRTRLPARSLREAQPEFL